VYTSLHFQTLEEKTEWLGDGRGITQNLKDFGYVFQTLTGDGILVGTVHPSDVHESDNVSHGQLYRCYLIWANNKWVAALPTFTYLISWGEYARSADVLGCAVLTLIDKVLALRD
jgi:hypothetical protein